MGHAHTPSPAPQTQSKCPCAPLNHPTQNLLGEIRAPYADLILSCLQSLSSVTLGAQHHNQMRRYLSSSNENEDQVRDVVNNDNG